MKTTDFLVLAVLADGPQHGYALAQAIADRSHQRATIRPGDLYRVLYRMAQAGLIQTTTTPRGQEDDGRRAYYCITPAGRRAAKDEAKYLLEVAASVLEGRPVKSGRSS